MILQIDDVDRALLIQCISLKLKYYHELSETAFKDEIKRLENLHNQLRYLLILHHDKQDMRY